MNKRIPVSVCLIALNEERNLSRCLESVSWAEEIILVDSGSSDRTVEIARARGAKVRFSPFVNFSHQRNVCVSLATQKWILVLDADECVSDELALAIRGIVEQQEQPETRMLGYWLTRKNFYLGAHIRHGEFAQEKKLRFYRRGEGVWDGMVHEWLEIDGPLGELPGELLHYSSPNISAFLRKMRRYAILQAQERHSKGLFLPWWGIVLYPCSRFLGGYVLQRGYRDGWRGFTIALLLGYYEFSKNVRLRKL